MHEITAPLKNVVCSLLADELGQERLHFSADSRSCRIYGIVNENFWQAQRQGKVWVYSGQSRLVLDAGFC